PHVTAFSRSRLELGVPVSSRSQLRPCPHQSVRVRVWIQQRFFARTPVCIFGQSSSNGRRSDIHSCRRLRGNPWGTCTPRAPGPPRSVDSTCAKSCFVVFS